MKGLRVSAVALWLLAPFLLWLSLYRPFVASRGLAEQLPRELPGFELASELPLTEREFGLLGTDDAIWWTYKDEAGYSARLVAVFHGANWKSVHPPHICLRGSNMEILEDEQRTLPPPATDVGVGRIVSRSLDSGEHYLNLYVFCAPDFVSGSYVQFFLHHAPLALLRSSENGCLLRVETSLDPEAPEQAEARLVRLLQQVLRPAEELLRP